MPLYNGYEQGKYYVHFQFEAENRADAAAKLERYQLWDPGDENIIFEFVKDGFEQADPAPEEVDTSAGD